MKAMTLGLVAAAVLLSGCMTRNKDSGQPRIQSPQDFRKPTKLTLRFTGTTNQEVKLRLRAHFDWADDASTNGYVGTLNASTQHCVETTVPQSSSNSSVRDTTLAIWNYGSLLYSVATNPAGVYVDLDLEWINHPIASLEVGYAPANATPVVWTVRDLKNMGDSITIHGLTITLHNITN